MKKRKQQHITFCHLFCSELVICETYHIQYSDLMTSLIYSICLDSKKRNGEEEKKLNFGIISCILFVYYNLCFVTSRKSDRQKHEQYWNIEKNLFLIDGQFRLFPRLFNLFPFHICSSCSLAINIFNGQK